jgi:hypothetical protein
MEQMDQLVLNRLVQRLLTPERVTEYLRQHQKHRQATDTQRLDSPNPSRAR